MTRGTTVTMLAAALLMPAAARAQLPQPPGTPVNLDRRVFIDVNQVAPNKVLDQLADAIACTLDVDRRLPQPDITLRLSNVRARTALDAVCDMVGCRWNLANRTLHVMATTPPPAVPAWRNTLDKWKEPLKGAQWTLVRVPLRDVLAMMSKQMGVTLVLEGVDLARPITVDLRNLSPIQALTRIGETGGWHTGGSAQLDLGSDGAMVVYLSGQKGNPAQTDRGATPVYEHDEPNLTMPVAIAQAKPAYTPETMEAKIQGLVVLSCVVEADGSVGDVEVRTSLDPVLDQQAIAAAKQWRFTPGTKDGKPVRVRIALEFTFTLK